MATSSNIVSSAMRNNEAPAPRPTYKRRKKLIDKPFQIRFSIDIAILVVATAVVIGGLTYFYDVIFSSQIISEFVPDESYAEYFSRLEEHAKFSFLMIFGFTTVCAVLLAVIGVFLTHRVAGPYVRFKRAVEELINGKVPCNIKLRKNDYGTDLADTLNQLFASLNEHNAAEIRTLESIKADLARLPLGPGGQDDVAALTAKINALLDSKKTREEAEPAPAAGAQETPQQEK